MFCLGIRYYKRSMVNTLKMRVGAVKVFMSTADV